MLRLTAATVALAFAASAGGCVSQQKVDMAERDIAVLEERVANLEAELTRQTAQTAMTLIESDKALKAAATLRGQVSMLVRQNGPEILAAEKGGDTARP